MAATFSNPRWDARPCEMMRGCSFADNFVTLERIAQNKGTDSGTGNTADNELGLVGTGWIAYDLVKQAGSFSVTAHFKATGAAAGNEVIMMNEPDVITGTPADGFAVWYDATSVKAGYTDGTDPPATHCSVTIDVHDSAWHTVTYIVNTVALTHSLYVDALAVSTQAIPAASAVGASNALEVGRGMIGYLHQPRIFNAVLTEAEHDIYHTGTLDTAFWNPYASYRCDAFNNDSVGHYLWDRTVSQRDIAKADRSTSAYFPTFVAETNTKDAHYKFDYADDYLGAITVPTTYTLTGCVSTPYAPYPVVEQDNDTSLSALLVASGGYLGNLHGMVIHSRVLTQLELYQDEYQHLYWQWRGRAWGAYHRLITQESCKLAMFLDADRGVYTDYSRLQANGSGFLVTRGGSAGCTFGSATSHVLVPDQTGLRSENLTIAVLGTFSGSVAAGTIVDKGANYKLLTNGNQIDFNGSTIAHTFSADDQHIAVTVKDGFKPRFFINGEYIGEGTTTENPDHTATTELVIGNNNELNSRTQYAIKQVYIGNEPLTDTEVKALYESAQFIGATSMETGARTRVRQAFAGVVDEDVDPGDAFQLIDVSVTFDVAPTTSENITIAIINSDADNIQQYAYDPSLSSDLDHVFRFDKRFEDGTTIAIDYANTDANNIVVNTTYQTDTSIT
jgi:hypothetical protein